MNFNIIKQMTEFSGEMMKDPGTKKQFHQWIIDNINEFDELSWDMFVEIIELDVDGMKSDIEFWRKIWPAIREIQYNSSGFGIGYNDKIISIQKICRDDLGL